MPTPTKTANQTLYALASNASGATYFGPTINVATKIAGYYHVHFARGAAAALTQGVVFRVEASAKDSGDGFWFPIATHTTDIVAAAEEAIVTSTAGSDTITVVSNTGFSARDAVFFSNGTVGNSEWGRIQSISGGTIVLEDGLVNDQDSSTMFNQAQFFSGNLDLFGVVRLRLAVDCVGVGQTTFAEAFLVTGDSIG